MLFGDSQYPIEGLKWILIVSFSTGSFQNKETKMNSFLRRGEERHEKPTKCSDLCIFYQDVARSTTWRSWMLGHDEPRHLFLWKEAEQRNKPLWKKKKRDTTKRI